MNIQDLNNLFGNDNLKKSQIYGAEGIGVYDVTIIYPDTDKELIIYWKDNKYGEKPESVTVKQKNSPWKLIYDIGIGSNLDAVSTTNKASIDINGFGWDYGGYVNDWHNGALSKSMLRAALFSAAFTAVLIIGIDQIWHVDGRGGNSHCL